MSVPTKPTAIHPDASAESQKTSAAARESIDTENASSDNVPRPNTSCTAALM
jgi:hypothetical protein